MKESKGGYFLVKIEYRGFEESCMFMTDWQEMKRYRVGYYRSLAITKEDLQNDLDLIKYFIKPVVRK